MFGSRKDKTLKRLVLQTGRWKTLKRPVTVVKLVGRVIPNPNLWNGTTIWRDFDMVRSFVVTLLFQFFGNRLQSAIWFEVATQRNIKVMVEPDHSDSRSKGIGWSIFHRNPVWHQNIGAEPLHGSSGWRWYMTLCSYLQLKEKLRALPPSDCSFPPYLKGNGNFVLHNHDFISAGHDSVFTLLWWFPTMSQIEVHIKWV